MPSTSSLEDQPIDVTPTERLYHTDSYSRACQARIVTIDGTALAVDCTIIYPGGGGQLADRGTLIWGEERMPVTGLHSHHDVVWHTVLPTAVDCPQLAIPSPVSSTGSFAIR